MWTILWPRQQVLFTNVGVHYKSPLRRYHSKHETEEFFPCNGFLLSLAEEPRSRKSPTADHFASDPKGPYVLRAFPGSK